MPNVSRAWEGSGGAALLKQPCDESPSEVPLNSIYWGDICTFADSCLHCRLVFHRKTLHWLRYFDLNISLLASFSIWII